MDRIPISETAQLAQQQLAHVAEKVTDAEAATIFSACRATVTTGLIITDLVCHHPGREEGLSAAGSSGLLHPQAWIIALLLELWLVLVVGHYVDELAERAAAARFGVDIENSLPPYRFAGVPPPGAEVRDEPVWEKYRSIGKSSRRGEKRTSKRSNVCMRLSAWRSMRDPPGETHRLVTSVADVAGSQQQTDLRYSNTTPVQVRPERLCLRR